MKKSFSKALLLFMVILTLTVIFGVSASAKTVTSGDFIFETTSSGAVLKSYTGNSASVEIPSKVSGTTVTEIGAEAFWQNKTMTSVTIPSGVKTISYAAFNECTSLKKVVIPSTVTKIDDAAFWYCTSLKKAVIPASVTVIGKDAFKGCNSLTAYVVSGSKGEEYIKSLSHVKLGYRYASEIKLNYTTLSVGLTAERQLTATLSPDELYNSKVTYKSSDEKVATVSSSGKIKAVGIGTATITVTASDGSKLSAKCTVTVNPQKAKTLKTSSVTANSVSLKWSTVTNASGYQVYKYNATTKKWEKLTNATKTTYTDNKVSMGDTAQYKVRAYTKVSSKTYYGEYSPTITVGMSKPGVVPKLTAAGAENYVKLTWTKADNANGYRVYIFDTKTNKFVRKTSTTALEAKITGLTTNTEYKFAVQAYYKPDSGDAIYSDNQKEVSVATRPASVSGLKYYENAVYFDKITLSWKAVDGVTGYEIHVLNTVNNSEQTKLVPYGDTTYVVSGLNPGTKYTFKIRAYTTRASEKTFSYYSSTVSAKTIALPATKQAAFDGFVEALNNTKNYGGNAVLYKDVAFKNFSGDRNDTIIESMAQAGSDTYTFTDGKTSSGAGVTAFIGPANQSCILDFSDIKSETMSYKGNGSGYEVTFTIGAEYADAAKNSKITTAVDWDAIEESANGFSLISCLYEGTKVTAKIQNGLISYMEISMPVKVSFKTGFINTYTFSQTIVTTTAFVAL